MKAAYPGDLLLHLASYLALIRRVNAGGPGAFERAASDSHVDRSVLRRRMQTLSDWIGAPLLSGRGPRLEATAAGRLLAPRAERLLLEARSLAADVSSGRERMVVACTGTITTELLPLVLLELEKRPRGIDLVVRRAGGALCETLVADGMADVGIVRASVAPRRFASHLLASDRLWLVLPKGHPLLARRPVTLEAMAEIPLVLYGETSRTRQRVMDRLGPLGARLRVEVEGRAAALEYVRRGLGATFVSLLPGHAVRHAGAPARDVTKLFAPSRFYVVAQRERWMDPALRCVVESLVRHAQKR